MVTHQDQNTDFLSVLSRILEILGGLHLQVRGYSSRHECQSYYLAWNNSFMFAVIYLYSRTI